jgi:hypothetical protein
MRGLAPGGFNAVSRPAPPDLAEARNLKSPRRHLKQGPVSGMVTIGNYPGPGPSKAVIYCDYSVR